MRNKLILKKKLYQHCVKSIDLRLTTIKNTILEIQNALLTETKSSAGDKHETGRAMLQLEREKAGAQLAEIQKIKEILSKIGVLKSSGIIGLGSIVYTSKSNYFIAISVGELKVQNDLFYAISASTPVGKLLIGKTVGDTIKFREQTFVIEQVL